MDQYYISYNKIVCIGDPISGIGLAVLVAGQKSENIQMYWKEVSDHGGLGPNQYKTLRKIFELVRYAPYFLRQVFYRLLLGKHKYHLVTLDAGMEPSLHEGNYYALEKRL